MSGDDATNNGFISLSCSLISSYFCLISFCLFFLLSVGSDNDQANSGFLHLFHPSSSVAVKHYIARMSTIEHRDRMLDVFTAGYFNTTSALDAVQFKFSSGNIDAGTIKLYGVS